jgi:hypothetical protein
MAQYVNIGEYLNRRAAALGIDTEGLIKTEEEIQAERQQAMAAQMAEKLGPESISQLGSALNDGNISLDQVAEASNAIASQS